MANVKITELTALTTPVGTDVLPIVDVLGDVTKKVTVADLNSATSTTTTDGDIIIRSSGSETRLPIGSEGQALLVSSGLPVWGNVAGGYTDPLTTDGDIVIRSGGASTRLGIGSEGQVLKVSSGLPVWAADAGGDVVLDTTPQLGGDLDVNGYDIVSASGGNVEIAPDTTGSFVIRGNNTDGSITLNCTANTHGVTIQSPPHASAATYTLILPDDTGTSGQVLSTNGTGTLSWLTPTEPGDNISTLTNDSGFVTSTVTGDFTVDTDTLYVDSTNNRVGIGTTSPATLLHAFGGYPTVKVQNNNTTQFASASLELQGPAGDERITKLLHGNLNTGGTESYFKIEQYDSAGTFVKTLSTYDYQFDFWSFNTAGSERIRIDSAGNVGLGTDTPSNKLHIQGTSSNILRCTNTQSFGQSDITLIGSRNTGGECGTVKFFNHRNAADPNDDAEVFASVAGVSASSDVTGTNKGGALVFSTRGTGNGDVLTERARILASGGIAFNGDNTAANALDDYEEGTWTPGIQGGTTAGSYTFTANGTYTKVGNKVTAWGDLTNITTVSAGSGSTVITGLPFVSALGFSAVGSIMLDQWDFSTSQRYAIARVQNGTDGVTPRMIRDNLSDNGLDITTKTNDTADIVFCVSYTVS